MCQMDHRLRLTLRLCVALFVVVVRVANAIDLNPLDLMYGQIHFMRGSSVPHATWVMNADGTDSHLLTQKSGAWSPDMKRIAYFDYNSMRLYTSRADGTDVDLVTNVQRLVNSITWSPDGEQIAFTYIDGSRGNKDHVGVDVYVVDADGSEPKNLTNTDDECNGAAWSPDGKRIAFAATADEDIGLYVINADGTDRHRVIGGGWEGFDLNDPLHPRPPFPEINRALIRIDTYSTAAWSPDGKRLAFAYEWFSPDGRNGPGQIGVIDADGGEPTVLTDADGYAQYPDWSPDGTKIAYHFRGNVYVYDLNSGENTALTNDDRSYFPKWVTVKPKKSVTWGELKAR